MNRNILQKGRRLRGLAYILRITAEQRSIGALIKADRIIKEMSQESLRIISSIALRDARLKPEQIGRFGDAYERNYYKTPYRCWGCLYFGEYDLCVNRFADRPACQIFQLNKILLAYPERLKSASTSKTMRRFKIIKSDNYGKHINNCKVCARISEKDISNKGKQVKMRRHYRKYQTRFKKKLAKLYAYFGLKYQDSYIFGWED